MFTRSTSSPALPPGIDSAPFYTHNGQSKTFSLYTSSYLASHPHVSNEIKMNLFSFSTQYLTRIADLEIGLIEKKCIPISPFYKNEYSYQRNYYNDKLLTKSALTLEKIWPNQHIRFCSNSAYLYSLKSYGPIIHIKNKNEIKRKLEKILFFLNLKFKDYEEKHDPNCADFKVSKHHFELYILFEADQNLFSHEDVKKQLESYLEITKEIISNYPFITPAYSDKINNSLHWAITSPSWVKNIHYLISNTTFFVDRINCAGSTPSVQQAAQIYAKSISHLYLTPNSLSNDINPAHISFTNQHLLFSPIFPLKLEDLLKNSLDYLKWRYETEKSEGNQILLEGTIALIEGLFSLEIEHKCLSFGIYDLIYHSAKRINHYVVVLSQSMDNGSFENLLDLITEEITLLLSLTKPYPQGELESVIQDKLVTPWPAPSLIKVTQSGIQCFMEIFYALKKANKQSNQMNIMYFDDIYFESVFFLDTLNIVQDTQQKNFVNSYKVPSQYKQGFTDVIDLFLIEEMKLNALFVDLHSASQAKRYKHRSHDIIENIKHLQSKGLLEPDFVCIIDNTIGMWGSEEINTLLYTFRKEIKTREIHFAIYKSSHKYDILGCDKFNGGSYIAYSHPESDFYKFLNKIPSSATADQVDYQMYTHFYKHASRSLQNYYKKITENTNIFFAKIDKSLIYDSNQKRRFWIPQKKDPLSTYFEVIFPLTTNFKIGKYLRQMDPHFEYVNMRNGFGYRNTTMSVFDTEGYTTLRVAIGIEDNARLTHLACFFNSIFFKLNQSNHEILNYV